MQKNILTFSKIYDTILCTVKFFIFLDFFILDFGGPKNLFTTLLFFRLLF